MLDESAQAYEFALEVATQLITLATAIIGLSVTFAKDVFNRTPSRLASTLLLLGWLSYVVSIWFGIGHIRALTGSLEWTAIERAAVMRADTSRSDSLWVEQRRAASDFLGSMTVPNDTTTVPPRERLARTGVMVGISARKEADRQIWAFLVGTILTVMYGGTLLLQRKPVTVSPPSPN